MTEAPQQPTPLPLKKRFERTAGRVALALVLKPVRAMSFAGAQRTGRIMGSLLYRLLGRYRRVAHKNIHLVYGNILSETERERLAKDVFIHFGQAVCEFLMIPEMSQDRLCALIDVEGAEHLAEAQREGKGILVASGHIGNFEVLAPWMQALGYHVNVVARKANDPAIDKMLQGTRAQNGATVHLRGSSGRSVLQCLKRGEVLALLFDQNAGDIYVPFFGMQTGTTNGPARIHLHTGAPIVFMWCISTPDGRFKLEVEEPVVINPTGDRAADEIAVTTLLNARLEAQIKKYPSQWLWLHDRWRNSPHVFQAEDQH